MPKHKLVFSANAKRDIKKLDRVSRQRIGKKLLYFMDQQDPLLFARPLIHSKIGSHRVRVGHYRIVFDVDGNNINVVSVKHRKDVYK